MKAELNAKSAKDLIAYARDTIAKTKILLQDNEQILEQEKRKMEELSAKNNQLHQDLTVQSSALEAIQVEYAAEISLTEEQMREKAMAVPEEIRQ